MKNSSNVKSKDMRFVFMCLLFVFIVEIIYEREDLLRINMPHNILLFHTSIIIINTNQMS
jgi:hypothetical protein